MARKLAGDHYFQKAKQESYAARSVYKLKELDQRFGLLKSGQRVLDLGASPGSWSQYTAKKVGPKGAVVAVDLKPPKEEIHGVAWRVADVTDLPAQELLAGDGPFDVVLSDMAPSTTGHKSVDASRSAGLAEAAFSLAERVLKPTGSVVVKVFMGPDYPGLVSSVRARFGRTRSIKPKACLKESRETYLLAWEPKRAEKEREDVRPFQMEHDQA